MFFFTLFDGVPAQDTRHEQQALLADTASTLYNRHIACLGALLTLLSLGVDFFAQQVLDTRIDQVADLSKENRTYNVDRARWVDSVKGYSNSSKS